MLKRGRIKMKKNIFFKKIGIIAVLSVFIFTLIIGFTNQTALASNSVHRELKIYVDDKELQFTDAKPYISEFGRTMIPIRAVTESFGANVDWNGILKKVIITYDDIEIYFLVVHPDNIVVINDLKRIKANLFQWTPSLL